MRGATRPGEVNQVLLEKLGAALVMTDPAERLARWQALMPLMRVEDAEGIRARLLLNRVEGRNFTEETTAFWRRCGLVDPVTALAWAVQEKGGRESQVRCSGRMGSRDSAAALAWLRANPDQPDQPDPEPGFETEPGISISGLMKGLAARSPGAAVELLLTNAGDPLFSSC
ncbi:MAG: hypothetical protein EOP86_18470 [Verrucomicrobiaceae bacterium]|nr:MAG: hypothetical protein EOP86_18470 [Verrucomicrobiaceae bacterium]